MHVHVSCQSCPGLLYRHVDPERSRLEERRPFPLTGRRRLVLTCWLKEPGGRPHGVSVLGHSSPQISSAEIIRRKESTRHAVNGYPMRRNPTVAK